MCHRRGGFSTSGFEVESEALVSAKAIRGEADVDMIRVSEEGRRGRSVATEWPQSPRGSLNLRTKQYGNVTKCTFPDVYP